MCRSCQLELAPLGSLQSIIRQSGIARSEFELQG